MWHNLASPPQNFRYYKFTESPADPNLPKKDIDLEEHKTSLFHPRTGEDQLQHVPEESLLSCRDAFTVKQPSSLRSTTRVNSRNQENCGFDLKVKGKNNQARQPSKSMLDHKQKSSVNLSHRNQSWVIRQEPSRGSASSKNNSKQAAFLQTIENQEQHESFSEILANEPSQSQFTKKSQENFPIDNNCFMEMMATLRQIRDISKEGLATKKKLLRLLQQKNQISFLYDKDASDTKQKPRKSLKKQQDKSFKKQQQDKSTIKKLGKSVHIEERLGKVEEKLRVLSKRVQEDLIIRKNTLGRTNKKSTSILR